MPALYGIAGISMQLIILSNVILSVIIQLNI